MKYNHDNRDWLDQALPSAPFSGAEPTKFSKPVSSYRPSSRCETAPVHDHATDHAIDRPQPLDLLHTPAGKKDYDEVYLSTRYASIDHWKASRDAVQHGGNGSDWVKCKAALDKRNSLTLSTTVIFLKGTMAPGGPYFMPGLDESYERKPNK